MAQGLASQGRHAAGDGSPAAGVTVFLDGYPWWPDQGSTGPHADETAARQAAIRAWQDHGEAMFAAARGAFALAVVDQARNRVALGVDRMGIGSLAHALAADGSLVFGTAVADVAGHPAIRAGLSPQALFDYFHFHMVPSPGTVHHGVAKLRPGHRLLFNAGRPEVSRYWHPRFAGALDAPLPELKADLLRIMESAVGRAAGNATAVGAFLSGGLDSSAVVGMLARAVAPDPARTFSVGFAAEEYNELGYARITAGRFGADAVELEVTPADVTAAIPLIARHYDEPFGNSSAVPAYFCALGARERGITRMLAGDGGDEIFGGNPHYTRQAVFELYSRVPSILRHRFCEGFLLRAIPEGAPFPLGKLRSYIDQARIPLPHRLHSWDFMYRTPATTVFTPEFLAMVDAGHPEHLQDPVYHEPETPEFLDRLLYFDWQFILADNDLRKVNGTCALAGVEVRYPMLDEELVDFSLRLPASLKVSGRTLRPFFKDASRGFLPDEVIGKQKHGFGLPFGLWLRTDPALRDLVLGSLAELKGRGLVRGDFLDRVVEEQRTGHASFYGYAIWDLLMLEQWLQAHGQAPGRRLF